MANEGNIDASTYTATKAQLTLEILRLKEENARMSDAQKLLEQRLEDLLSRVNAVTGTQPPDLYILSPLFKMEVKRHSAYEHLTEYLRRRAVGSRWELSDQKELGHIVEQLRLLSDKAEVQAFYRRVYGQTRELVVNGTWSLPLDQEYSAFAEELRTMEL